MNFLSWNSKLEENFFAKKKGLEKTLSLEENKY